VASESGSSRIARARRVAVALGRFVWISRSLVRSTRSPTSYRLQVIAYEFQTGTQWVHLPEKYGNWRGIYNRLLMWSVDGTWERVFTALVAQAEADEDLGWAVSVDSTIVRLTSTRPGPVKAHQHAAGPVKRGPGRRTRRPRHRPFLRWTDHQGPPRRRCPLPAPRVRPHRRTSRWCTCLHLRGRRGSRGPARTATGSVEAAGAAGNQLVRPMTQTKRPRPTPGLRPLREPPVGGRSGGTERRRRQLLPGGNPTWLRGR